MPGQPPPVKGTLESALYVGDLDTAERFYRDILGLPVVARVDGRHVFFRAGASILLIFNPEATARPPRPDSPLPVPPHGAHGPGHYCFSVASRALEAWRAHLERRGVAIEADFRWPNGARSIYVRDPAGNSVEFAETKLWEEQAKPAVSAGGGRWQQRVRGSDGQRTPPKSGQ